jgi:hypothetical protein
VTKSTKAPAFQFYAAEFLSDENVVLMTNQEVGCYIKLMAYCWREGSIPADVAKIGRLCGELDMPTLWPSISCCFDAQEGNTARLVHPRLEKERNKQGEFKEKRSVAGSAGASSKWGEASGKTPGKTRSERLADARQKGTHTKEEWEALKHVCGSACLRCGTDDVKFVKDHITPIYQGGSDSIENLQPLCGTCNSSKGPEQIDYRPNDWHERLANACQMPGFSSSSSSSTSKSSSPTVQKTKTQRAPRFDAQAHLVGLGVDAQHAADWLTNRKKKDLAPTLTAMEQTAHEAEKAGMTLSEAIKVAAGMGWGGFMAKWVEAEEAKGAQLRATPGATPVSKAQARHDGLDAAAAEFAARMAAKHGEPAPEAGYVPPDDGKTFEME